MNICSMVNKEKLLLIIQREYLVRFRSKIFVVTTVLAPLIMILLMVLPALIQSLSGDQSRQFLVYDETGIIGRQMAEGAPGFYQISENEPDKLREELQNGEIDGYITIPHEILDGMGSAAFYHDGSAGMNTAARIRSDIRETVRDIRLERLDTSEEIRAVLADHAGMDNFMIAESGEETADSGLSAFIGFIMGFIIYGAMIGYGAIIMRGVMEEKTSKVVEVIASSVRPFELLMGKVIGVALLGLTQFVIWAAAGALLLIAAGPLIALFTGGAETAETAEAAAINLPVIGPMVWIGFVLFFLLGFLIYSSLFAAVGSAIDQESDSQQLQLPIVMLIIIPLMFLFTISEQPTSTLAVIMSMIPFFAPILMPVRMAVISVPIWQLGTTIFLMILTFILLIWLSARIYRTGILMYGKKASFRELWRWVRQD